MSGPVGQSVYVDHENWPRQDETGYPWIFKGASVKGHSQVHWEQTQNLPLVMVQEVCGYIGWTKLVQLSFFVHCPMQQKAT